jgi:hypothetical protein
VDGVEDESLRRGHVVCDSANGSELRGIFRGLFVTSTSISMSPLDQRRREKRKHLFSRCGS